MGRGPDFLFALGFPEFTISQQKELSEFQTWLSERFPDLVPEVIFSPCFFQKPLRVGQTPW